MKKNQTVVIIGLGYIGLPTAVMFAANGYQVVGIDHNEAVIDSLQKGKVHIEEPGLQAAFEAVLQPGHLQIQKTMAFGDVFVVAVPTPNKKDTYKSCDLSFVVSAITNLLPYLRFGNTIIIESTVAPGTTEKIILPIIEQAGFIVGENLFLVHCPERVLPGKILYELTHNNRIIGGVTEACIQKGLGIYASLCQGELLPASASAAELSKLMENTYRDVNIALANELAKVGYALGIDALEVIRLANKHPRVFIHTPGPGVGGHCLAVDPYFIAAETPQNTALIQSARKINTDMPVFVYDLVLRAMKRNNGKKITVLGVTYKGNVDDIRESPAIEIINKLKAETDYEIVVFDSHVKLDWLEADFEKAVDESDLLLILTDHDEFKNLTFQQLQRMNQYFVIDTKQVMVEQPGIELIHLGNAYKLKASEKDFD